MTQNMHHRARSVRLLFGRQPFSESLQLCRFVGNEAFSGMRDYSIQIAYIARWLGEAQLHIFVGKYLIGQPGATGLS
jgi:hypothetical protein